MGSNIIELAKLGHERAAELKASCGAVDVRSLAQLISDLSTQLEVQHVRSTNMAVQLANAESKCRELAAENENARNAVQVFCDVVGANTDAICEEVGRDGVRAILAAMNATGNMPATDAFLAEVRAQGVEMFADDLLCPDLDSTIREFAYQLRKGAAL
ncbi:hypothetical protein JKB30_002921 [Salmonella enterica]|uniref:hypothetical protein n=1 Tax=Salmonella enterica TaxID=28901 RepID=UPI0009AC279D|nr:hypothetical protein [Salmonella enterica]EDV3755310.1 hypothetical protein [Salmonella enterica subsp. enterica]EAS1718267.1 hypothetical protein [Salmonella enterica]EAW9177628.1 hypothetical protein [Salmonella enterica]EAX8697443.1 hypothetical protein [Salmonella enterica]EAX9528122.1 hypothetical protein [Salmonella enterica]